MKNLSGLQVQVFYRPDDLPWLAKIVKVLEEINYYYWQ